jgi:cell division protein FtsZ
MGGGTGTGAGPIIAKCARERGILTVGVVTKPFHFEGRHRMRLADSGISELQRYVDTLIVIPNQNLFRVANERTTFAEAFAMADQVLHSGVRSITDLMVLPGLINLDFADVRTVMTEMGKAMMGTGEATGEGRALMAAENAIQNPLLDEVTLKGAKAVLVNITGGLDMTLLEVDEAANAISAQVDPEANIIFGAAFDPTLESTLRVSVVATGMDGMSIAAIEPAPRRTGTTARRTEAPAPAPLPEPVAAYEPAPAYVAPEPEPIRPAAFEPLPEPEPVFEPELAYEAPQPFTLPPPKIFEPLRGPYSSAPRGGGGAAAEAVDLRREEPLFEAPEPQPVYEQPAVRQPQVVTKIVDPSVAEEEDILFPQTAHYAVDRRQKGGIFSMFNRRQDAPRATLRPAPAPEPTVQPMSQGRAEETDDLEIPSFLRRLAN